MAIVPKNISDLDVYAKQHGKRSGSLEPDLFIINDVVLTIPPSQITVNKNSFKNEWSTLRTTSSRKMKSGYSTAEVNLNIVFQGEDVASKLVPLIAGLRATPFASIHNPYLDNILTNNEKTKEDSESSSTVGYQNIVLALTQATFTTQGHTGKPGCIEANLSFLWFNYFPYTPIWAYKTGKSHGTPGYAWNSEVWRKFYEPFRGTPTSFPYKQSHKRTSFSWNEFKLIMSGNKQNKQLAQSLINVIKKRPEEVLNWAEEAFKNQIAFADNSTGLYNYLLKKAAGEGWLEDFKYDKDLTRDAIASGGSPSGEKIAEGLTGKVLSQAIKRSQTDGIQAGVKYLKSSGKIDQAIKILADRINNTVSIDDLDTASGYIKLTELDVDYGYKGEYSFKKVSHKVGAMALYARPRYFTIDPPQNTFNSDGTSTVIEAISVTISNRIALIPLIGYTYPTCQHMGNTDMNITMSVNAHNTNLKNIHDMYSSLETISRKFRHVPQPYRNLKVNNDFLGLFQVTELITDSIDTQTASPDRSIVTINFCDPGLSKKDKLQDAEQLQQEYVQQDKTIQEAIWKVLGKYISKTISGKKIYFESVISKNHKSKALFGSLNEKATSNLNDWMKTLKSEIIDAGTSIDRHRAAAALFGLSANPNYSFIPGLNKVVKAITQLDKAKKSRYPEDYFSISGAKFESDKTIKSIEHFKKERAKYTSDKTQTDYEVLAKMKEAKQRGISAIEVNDYLSEQIDLINKIKDNSLGLKEFEHISKDYYKLGLNEGLPAYPDFKEQLNAVRSLAPTGTEIREIDLDPDVYMWYPIYGAKSASESLIDPVFKKNVKELSMKVYNSSEKDIGTWFEKKYVKDLKNPQVSGPYDRLIKETGGKFAGGMYKGSSGQGMTYSSAALQETIKKTLLTDPESRLYTHMPDQKNNHIKPQGKLFHTTDLSKWLNGTQQTSGKSPTAQQVDINLPLREAEKAVLPYVKKYAKKYSLPPDLVMGLIHAESTFRQYVASENKKTGKKIAYGYMQLKKSTANELSRKINRTYTDIYDPDFNIEAGCYYLSSLRKRFGDEMGIAGYNRGDGRVKRWKQKGYSTVESLPKGVHGMKARQYVASVKKYRKRFTNILTAENLKRVKNPPASTTFGSLNATGSIQSPFDKALLNFEKKVVSGHLQSLMRAYPTFKLYFIEEDYEEKRRLAFDDFFSYNAVKSIRVVRSKHIAADLCDIVLTNVSGILSNRKFDKNAGSRNPLDKSGKKLKETSDKSKAGTSEENPLGSFMLQEGMDISLLLGYTNDPKGLTTVFNGKITSIEFTETDDLVRIIAQSYAIELVQDIKGIDKPKQRTGNTYGGWDIWGLNDETTTGKILEEMMASPEVVHFGRWKAGDSVNPARDSLTEKWRWWPTPYDDNLFPPPKSEDYLLSNKKDWFISAHKYTIYQTTIWDIIQEMTMRHPNYIASPVPYEDEYGVRMTMFFGLPDQLYFSRHPNVEETQIINKIKAYEQIKQKAVKTAEQKHTGFGAPPGARELEKASNRRKAEADSSIFLFDKALKKAKLEAATSAGYIQPFRNYHFYTSGHHIISNNIKANSRDVANSITINYRRGSTVPEDLTVPIYGTPTGKDYDFWAGTISESYTMKLDNAIPPEELQVQLGSFVNVRNEPLARRYSLAMLLQNVRNIYKGDFTVIGDPDPKPYDTCFIYDEYTDMVGPVEVEQVTHLFTQEEGFRTIIKPDMLASVSEFHGLTVAQAFSQITHKVVMDIVGQSPAFGDNAFGTWLHGFAYHFYSGGAHAATNLFDKTILRGTIKKAIVNYTSSGLPIIMLPLSYKGREFTGGISTRKIPHSKWDIFADKWRPQMLRDTDMWQSSLYEDMTNLANKLVGNYSVGEIGGK